MDDYVFRILELGKVLTMLSEYCVSTAGAERAIALRPAPEAARVHALQQQTAEAEGVYSFLGYTPVLSFLNCEQALAKSRVGGMLTMGELLQVRDLLCASRRLVQSLRGANTDERPCTLLCGLADGLAYDDSLEKHIGQCIHSEDEMSDFASSALADLRRRIRKENARIREKLDEYVRSSAKQKYLQDNIVTMRNGRYVIPVKQEYRRMVPGLVHDQSGSNQTLFIEPMALVEANNTIRMLQGEERAEIERILYALSAQVSPIAQELIGNIDILADMDVIFAKAQLSRRMKALQPVMGASDLRIDGGRHPLIHPDAVVPVDVGMPTGCHGLVITGPNTGGKTVTLKMVGLFSAMAGCGLHLPSRTPCHLPIFRDVLADVGDEQSIEQSLSTFSSHMTNIIRVLQTAQPDSLVLLDELGAGTDPSEGSALALAILDKLVRTGCYILVTTHYSELKAYAMNCPVLDNASMEFNTQTLRPTYKVLAGVAGRSNALEVAQRLGMQEGIIQAARGYLSNERIAFDDMMGQARLQLEAAQAEREKARAEVEQARAEAAKAREKAAVQEQKAQEALAKAREKAQSLLQDTRVQAENAIREIKRSASMTAEERNAAIAQARRELAKSWENVKDKAHKPAGAAVDPQALKVGDAVLVQPLDTPAVVAGPVSERGEVLVQAGSVRMTVKVKNLTRAATPQKREEAASHAFMRTESLSMELDLRGNTVEEGLQTLDSYLDSASVSGLKTVHVIHGKGTGALRAGVQQFLRHHPHVKSFRIGNYGEGDSGVTVVTLK